ncbi:MAG: hypothetical protein GYA14_10975, partial [Ignavibacteria bacterium]|nr:hypothetical protein [Ignavibacteria bacterium]
SLIGKKISFGDLNEDQIPTYDFDKSLSESDVKKYQLKADKIVGKSIFLSFELQKFTLDDSAMVKMISADGFYNDEIDRYSDEISQSIDRDSQDPKFEFNGNKVTEFVPALDGIKTNKQVLRDSIKLSIVKLIETSDVSSNIEIPVVRSQPKISTNEVNNLGIKELIGKGESTYYHSIPGRVFNVDLAASRINGTLVKPGDTFSFNQILGDVSKETGYKEAYVIQEGRTVLGDGGGVCQVSSTLFRAVLNAGLPILERSAHAYRVGYYEQGSQPGFDATVYSPSPDFKFKNDTQSYILVQAKNNPKKYYLTFELYGIKDGRVATVSKPNITNKTPPPPDVYQDDPTIPAGQIKQVDYAAWGARVSFNYKVTKNGEVLIDKNYVSNYQPWQAIYLRGTGPAN